MCGRNKDKDIKQKEFLYEGMIHIRQPRSDSDDVGYWAE